MQKTWNEDLFCQKNVTEKGWGRIEGLGNVWLPGFIDLHSHIDSSGQGVPAEYEFKFWMAHGIAAICEPSCGNGLDWVLEHKRKRESNEITAACIYAYTFLGQGNKQTIATVDQARAWVNENAKRGTDGIKFFGACPELIDAAICENKRLGLRSCCHHVQMDVFRWNMLHSARAGLTSMQH